MSLAISSPSNIFWIHGSGKVYAQEVPLYSDYLGVAGRVDCIAEFDGKLSVIDFKTSRRFKSADKINNYFQQEAFYAIAWEERTGIPITQLVTLIVVDDGSTQVFIEHRDDWAENCKRRLKSIMKDNIREIHDEVEQMRSLNDSQTVSCRTHRSLHTCRISGSSFETWKGH